MSKRKKKCEGNQFRILANAEYMRVYYLMIYVKTKKVLIPKDKNVLVGFLLISFRTITLESRIGYSTFLLNQG